MRIHNLIQGSPEWIAHRATHFNASDAPAMMGVSPYKTRAELLRELHTGVAPVIDTATSKRFANGHRVEALARPLGEEFIGAELYPVTGSEGRYSASFDGLTMDESIGFEHKALNEELSNARLDEDGGAKRIPLHHRVQMEQQLMVSGADRILFMASAWDGEELLEERHCWYHSDPKLRADIVDGWAQFERDLAAYVLPESAAPAPVGKAPDTLPALRIEVTGQVTASNLAEFKQTALAAIRSVNRDLSTDQDFADAEKAVKWCEDVESRIKGAKEHALSQTTSIDMLFKTMDDISAEARRVRLDLDKLVTRRKTEVKEEAIDRARKAFDMHVAVIHAEIAPMRIPLWLPDFAGAIKGKRSIASMQDALDTTLAEAKIKADTAARLIRSNLNTFRIEADTFEFLFPDLGSVISKDTDHFQMLVQSRIAAHQAAEAKRIEAERERIRAEEAARVAKQAEDARIAAEHRMAPFYDAARLRVGHDLPYEVYLSFAGNGHGSKVPLDKVDEYIAALNALQPERTESAVVLGTPSPYAGNVAQAAQATPSGSRNGAHAEQSAPVSYTPPGTRSAAAAPPANVQQPCLRYGPGGALVCDELPPALVGYVPLLGDESARYYGGRYMIAESMSRGVAKKIAEALGATMMDAKEAVAA